MWHRGSAVVAPFAWISMWLSTVRLIAPDQDLLAFTPSLSTGPSLNGCRWKYSALGGVKIVSNPNKGNSRAGDRRKVEREWERGETLHAVRKKKGNSGFHSLHINIPLTSAGSITAWQCGYAFSAWNLKWNYGGGGEGGGGGGEIAVSFLPIFSSSLFRPFALSRVTLIQFQLCLWQL